MKFNCIIITLLLCMVFSCGKKNKKPEPPAVAPPVSNPDTGPKCQTLPPAPVPFGWQDSVADVNKSINAFLFDPANSDNIIYVVNGDAFGYNKMYRYHIPTKSSIYLCTLSEYLPQVNAKGWITFSDVENNVYLIKNNSDSLIQLTNTLRCHNPQWDYSGNYIYYYEEAFFTLSSRINKMDANGNYISSFETALPYFTSLKNKDALLVVETKNDQSTVKLKVLSQPTSEQNLISATLYSEPGQIYFDNLILDSSDEYFYWSNTFGIFKCQISSLKADTVLKNCENLIHRSPLLSLKNNELTYTQEVITPITSLVLFHEFKTLEMNLYTGQKREIKIFP